MQTEPASRNPAPPRTPGGRAAAAALCLLLLAAACGTATAGGIYDLDSGREAVLITAGLAGGGIALLNSRAQQPLTPEEIADLDADQVWAFDRFATRRWSDRAAAASDIGGYGMAAAPLLLLAETGSRMDGGELLMMYGETVLLQQAVVGLLKSAVGRPRPYVYNDDPRIDPGYKQSRFAVRSFPSGHTATAFAAAVFTGEVYAKLNPGKSSRHWVRGAGLAAAAATGWLRVASGRHFLSDVVAGAVIGSLAGWAVPRLHEVDGGGAGGKGMAAPLVVVGFGF